MANALLSLNKATGEYVELSPKQKHQNGKNFCMVDLDSANYLSDCRELTKTDHRLLWYLLSKMDYQNFVSLTQPFIASALEIPQPQVSLCIKKLSLMGVISKVTVGGRLCYYVEPAFAVRGNRNSKAHKEIAIPREEL